MPRKQGTCGSDNIVLTAHQGDDKRWVLKLKRDDGSPFSLVGYTAAAQLRTSVADIDDVVAADLEVEVVDPAGGVVTMTLYSVVSRTLVAPEYVWELEIVETATLWTTTIMRGTLTVTKEITRTSA